MFELEVEVAPRTSLPPVLPYEGPEPYAFVSYCHADAANVFPEVRRLDLMTYRVWFDEGIAPGSDWAGAISEALSESSAFLVFITPSSVKSKYVLREIAYADDEDKHCVAVHLTETKLPKALRLRMGANQAILKHSMDEARYVRQLRRCLPAKTASSPPSPSGRSGHDSRGHPQELVEALARAAHQTYVNATRRLWGPGRRPTVEHWEDLSDEAQEANRQGARRFIDSLEGIHFAIRRGSRDSRVYRLNRQQIRFVAQLQHLDWCKQLTEAGWRHGSKRDNEKRLHPHLVPWQKLTKQEREINLDLVAELARVPDKVGFHIVPPYCG